MEANDLYSAYLQPEHHFSVSMWGRVHVDFVKKTIFATFWKLYTLDADKARENKNLIFSFQTNTCSETTLSL